MLDYEIHSNNAELKDEQDTLINNILDNGLMNCTSFKPHIQNDSYSNRSRSTYSYDTFPLTIPKNINQQQQPTLTNRTKTHQHKGIPTHDLYTNFKHFNHQINTNSKQWKNKCNNTVENVAVSLNNNNKYELRDFSEMRNNLYNLQEKMCGLIPNTTTNKNKPKNKNLINKPVKQSNPKSQLKRQRNKSMFIETSTPTWSGSKLTLCEKTKTIWTNASKTEKKRNAKINNSAVIAKSKIKKCLSEDEIWKEKYESLLIDLDQIKNQLKNERKSNQELSDVIKSIKMKDAKWPKLRSYNEEWVATQISLQEKFEQSEKIRYEQIQYIYHLQEEVQAMRKRLNQVSPINI